MNKVLRCYATGREGQWAAFCIDFDLAVQGRSFQEVYDRLNDAIRDYVERVHELPEADRVRLLRRRAPLGSRLQFLGALIASALRSHGDDDERHGYTLPCAA